LNVPADPRVVVGIRTSDDAGVMELEGTDTVLIQTVDFITPVCDDPYWFGRVAAANSLSDIYAMGGRPMSALNICCFPHKGPTRNQYAEILRGGLDVLNEAGAVLLGGQTVKNDEIKYGMSVTGTALKSQLTPNSGAAPGDALILTKPIGTGVLVGAYRSGDITEEAYMPFVERMAELNRVASLAMVEAGCRGATDITGFGLAGHGWEMAKASGVKMVFHIGSIPVYKEARDLLTQNIAAGKLGRDIKWAQGNVRAESGVAAEDLHLFADPQTSGGLLIAIAESKAEELCQKLQERGVEDAAIVGHVEQSNEPLIQILP
jgi:selenide,water dikinase